ncbi:MAG: hypothetical protein WAQ53_11970 [Thiofilum sp.]|uniref:hypothetical protein n=1 Tax=Thiofilum sp. TaxID=2212733 RepID=UPI0025E196E0|nr:hypothetical protein [Thiofilum sp.]MBK8454234.1 hypothetical protein [Thiofilum sp.]
MQYLLACILLVLSSLSWAEQTREFEVFCGKPFADANSSIGSKVVSGIVEGVEAGATTSLDPWSYEFYERNYGEEEDSAADEANCLTPSRKKLIEGYATEMLQAYERLGFAYPYPHLGPVVKGKQGKPVIRLYMTDLDSPANTSSACVNGVYDPYRVSFMRLNRADFQLSAEPMIYHWLAHEIVHVLQASNALSQGKPCGTDKWITEGTADALSLKLARNKFPNWKPGATGYGKSWYGVKKYPNNMVTPPKHLDIEDYYVSSFWRYLAERYYNDDYSYTARYYQKSTWLNKEEDALKWLNNYLKSESAITQYTKGGLYLLFPDFLAAYSLWGEKRFPELGESMWLSRTFRGCHLVKLDPQKNPQTLQLKMEPLSGQCINIQVTGLSPNSLSAVKIIAQDKSTQNLDNIHLATAKLGSKVVGMPFKDLFNCYDALNAYPQGTCLEKPFTGKQKTDGLHPKTWLTHQQDNNAGTYTNRIIVVHSPKDPTDKVHSSRNTQIVNLEFGLEISTLQSTATGKAPVKKAQGAVLNHAAQNKDGLGATPMQGGEKSTDSFMNIFGSSEGLSQSFFLMPQIANVQGMMQNTLFETITQFSLEQVELPSEGDELATKASFHLSVLPAGVPFGAKGNFKGMASGILGDSGVEDILFPWPVPKSPNAIPSNGTVEVIEYSSRLLQVKLSGTVCRWGNLIRDRQGMVIGCKKIDSFSGEIIKPFGWLYDMKQTFSSIDTEGMKVYRDNLYSTISTMMPSLFPAPTNKDNEDSANDEGSNMTANPQILSCDCSCDGMKKIQALGEQMENSDNLMAPPPELMQAMQCMGQCMSQYMQCSETE